MADSPTYRLTDEQWDALRDLLPTNTGKRGGQWHDHRTMIDGILWVLADGGRWRNVPAEFGPWQSVYDRFRRWTRSGLWDAVLAALRGRKAEAGQIDGRLYSIDGSVVRAHVSAAGASPKNLPDGEPADHALGRSQGGFGTKVHMICDGNGLPLAVTVGPGQEHETRQVHDLFEQILEEERVPKHLAGDKAYSAGWLRELLAEIGIKPVIPHKSNEKAKPKRFPRKLYKGRHVIECCFGRLKWLRRIATRYEKLALHYLGMLNLAIIYRFIAS
jgi:transposase